MSITTTTPSSLRSPSPPRRSLRPARDFPLIPVLILVSSRSSRSSPTCWRRTIRRSAALTARFQPPFWQAGGSDDYLLGTDQLGRDVLSRLIFGARVSMVVGFTAVLFAGVVGTMLGIVSGYLGGWVDQVIMRITDAWLALPALTFAIFLAAIVGPSDLNIVIILGLVYWTRYARVIRGEVLSLKEREFVRLAIVAGCSKRTIMRRHILPNVINSAIVLATLMLGVVIVTEASLSFLGVGVPPPQAGLGPDAVGRQAGADGRLLVAHRAARPLHHADGAVGQPSGRLAACQTRPATPPALSLDRRGGRNRAGRCSSFDNLSTHYVSPQGTRVVRAVDDVSLQHQRRRDARHRRRSRARARARWR